MRLTWLGFIVAQKVAHRLQGLDGQGCNKGWSEGTSTLGPNDGCRSYGDSYENWFLVVKKLQ